MKAKQILPYIQTSFRILLGALLLVAGILKVQDNSALFESVAYITWIPLGLKSLIIDTLPWIEIVMGSLLIFNLFGSVVKPAVSAIYLAFFIFAIYGLGSGMEGDCGCFGDPENGSILAMLLGSEFGWKMVMRNGIFVGMAGLLFLKTGNNSTDSPE
ncbi:MauE/DoxX family redox-associated membrane protein [Rhodohalobacter mucosus]|nr:MauE/DoxX family redox-associated membrane protein [Rhodohalobacter mucosus]